LNILAEGVGADIIRRSISDKTFVHEPNSLHLKTLHPEFNNSDEASHNNFSAGFASTILHFLCYQ
jgi:hypothetical protein